MKRLLRKNMKPFWYAPYESKEMMVDEWGNSTGEPIIIRSNPIKHKGSISAGRGLSDVDVFGINSTHDRTIALSGIKHNIDEAAVFWIDKDPEIDNEGKPTVAHDYMVARPPAVGLTDTLIPIKKVDVSI